MTIARMAQVRMCYLNNDCDESGSGSSGYVDETGSGSYMPSRPQLQRGWIRLISSSSTGSKTTLDRCRYAITVNPKITQSYLNSRILWDLVIMIFTSLFSWDLIVIWEVSHFNVTDSLINTNIQGQIE